MPAPVAGLQQLPVAGHEHEYGDHGCQQDKPANQTDEQPHHHANDSAERRQCCRGDEQQEKVHLYIHPLSPAPTL